MKGKSALPGLVFWLLGGVMPAAAGMAEQAQNLLTPSAPDIPPCEWRVLERFRECMLVRFPVGSSAQVLERYLHNEGFSLARPAATERFLYFYKTANGLAHYKAVVILFRDNDTITRLELP